MGLIQYLRSIREGSALAGRLEAEEKDNRRLREIQLQLSKDILSLSEESRLYRGNTYRDYAETVQEIDNKYNGKSDWGVFLTGIIIDLRAVFIIAEGIKIYALEGKEKEAARELDFAKKFLSYNDLDAELAQECAKEAEIEGKILFKLAWEKDEEQISARYISWLEKCYKIETHPQDYLWYTKAIWTPKGAQASESLEEKEFVYKKFGGRLNNPESAMPKVGRVLTQIENHDKALRDFREINRIFAGPLLVVEFPNIAAARQGQIDLDSFNFKIKKALSTTGKANYVQPAAPTALVDEIVTLIKVISGATGIPVHFLGAPDLLSNRATASNLMELISAATSKERKTWEGVYRELLSKAMQIYNVKMGLEQKPTQKLDPQKLAVEIPLVSAENWAAVEKVFAPLSISGKISDELLLSKIPGVNVTAEIARKEEEKKAEPEPLEKVPPTVPAAVPGAGESELVEEA
jgi:hypothetical protein